MKPIALSEWNGEVGHAVVHANAKHVVAISGSMRQAAAPRRALRGVHRAPWHRLKPHRRGRFWDANCLKGWNG